MDRERITCEACGQTCAAHQFKRHKNSAVCKAIANANKYSELHGNSNDDIPIAQIVFGNCEGGSNMSEKHMRQTCKKYGCYDSVVGGKTSKK